MKRLQELSNEINNLTLMNELEYPELYQYLDENSITFTCFDHPKVNTKNFSDYLSSLKPLLKQHIVNKQKLNK